jgi:hypothetical protein
MPLWKYWKLKQGMVFYWPRNILELLVIQINTLCHIYRKNCRPIKCGLYWCYIVSGVSFLPIAFLPDPYLVSVVISMWKCFSLFCKGFVSFVFIYWHVLLFNTISISDDVRVIKHYSAICGVHVGTAFPSRSPVFIGVHVSQS